MDCNYSKSCWLTFHMTFYLSFSICKSVANTVYSLKTGPSSDTKILSNWNTMQSSSHSYLSFLEKLRQAVPFRELACQSVFTHSPAVGLGPVWVTQIHFPSSSGISTSTESIKHLSLPAVALGPPQGETPFPSSSSSPSLPQLQLPMWEIEDLNSKSCGIPLL